MLKAKGNYSVLKDIKNIEVFNKLFNEDFDKKGIYINDGKNKRYFCNSCKTIGPTTYKVWGYTTTCPNCSATLMNIDVYSSSKPFLTKLTLDNNAIYMDEFIAEIVENRSLLDVTKKSHKILELGERLYYNLDQRSYLNDIFNYGDQMSFIINELEDMCKSGKLVTNNLNYILNNYDSFLSFFDEIGDKIGFEFRNGYYTAKLLELAVYDIIDFESWLSHKEGKIHFPYLVELSIDVNMNDDNSRILYGPMIDNGNYKTPEALISKMPKWLKDEDLIKSFYYYLKSHTLVDVLGYIGIIETCNNMLDANEEAFYKLIALSKTEDFNLFSEINELNDLISKHLGTIPLEEALEIISKYYNDNRFYGFSRHYYSRRFYNTIGSLKIILTYINKENLEPSIYNVNRKFYNELINKANMKEKYNLPDDKLELFHSLVQKDPLEAYSLLNNRRSLNSKELAKYVKLLD